MPQIYTRSKTDKRSKYIHQICSNNISFAICPRYIQDANVQAQRRNKQMYFLDMQKKPIYIVSRYVQEAKDISDTCRRSNIFPSHRQKKTNIFPRLLEEANIFPTCTKSNYISQTQKRGTYNPCACRGSRPSLLDRTNQDYFFFS